MKKFLYKKIKTYSTKKFRISYEERNTLSRWIFYKNFLLIVITG